MYSGASVTKNSNIGDEITKYSQPCDLLCIAFAAQLYVMEASNRRRVQVVNTNAERRRDIRWMESKSADPHFSGLLFASAVDEFPCIFTQRNRGAIREKARQWVGDS